MVGARLLLVLLGCEMLSPPEAASPMPAPAPEAPAEPPPEPTDPLAGLTLEANTPDGSFVLYDEPAITCGNEIDTAQVYRPMRCAW